MNLRDLVEPGYKHKSKTEALSETYPKLRVIADRLDLEPDAWPGLHEEAKALLAENEELRNTVTFLKGYVGDEMVRSDFQTAGHMRKALDSVRAEELVAHLKLNNGHAIHGLEYESGGLKYESICDGTDCDRAFCSHPHDVQHVKEILDTVEREAREAARAENELLKREIELAKGDEFGRIVCDYCVKPTDRFDILCLRCMALRHHHQKGVK